MTDIVPINTAVEKAETHFADLDKRLADILGGPQVAYGSEDPYAGAVMPAEDEPLGELPRGFMSGLIIAHIGAELAGQGIQAVHAVAEKLGDARESAVVRLDAEPGIRRDMLRTGQWVTSAARDFGRNIFRSES